jgi:hypothetical protein
LNPSTPSSLARVARHGAPQAQPNNAGVPVVGHRRQHVGEGAFQVVLIWPDGYPHAGAFKEVTETVAYGLRAAGCEVTLAVNKLVKPGPPAVIFGANLLTPEEAAVVPDDTIIYNLEQIGDTNSWCTPTYLGLLRRCLVWDYSQRNIAALARLGVERTQHVPVGYVPELTRIHDQLPQDIDVLFYGSMNDRRAAVIEQLRGLGLNVAAVFGVYGDDRDSLIGRSKVVLNLHYYDTSIFELVRVSYLLANRKAVVAECHNGTEIDADLRDGIALAHYGDLAGTCSQLVRDHTARAHLAERGYQAMVARDEAGYLRTVLGLRNAAAAQPALP